MTQLVHKLWWIGLGLTVMGVAIAAASLLVRNRIDQETGTDTFSPLVEETRFDFTPTHNDINIIIIRLKNPGLANKEPHELQIRNGEVVLAAQEFSGINVGDPSDLRIQFAPLPDTQGQLLTLVLRELKSSDQPLQVGKNRDGALSFQAFYRSNQLPSAFISNLTDPGFLLLWGGTIALLLI